MGTEWVASKPHHSAGATSWAIVRWLFVLPVTAIVYVIVSAVTGLLGAFYAGGGLFSLIVALVLSPTFPIWVLERVFDPYTVIYLAQCLLGISLAIYAG